MSERYVGLPHRTAVLAAETLYLQRKVARLAAERKVVEGATDNTILDNIMTAAMRTCVSFLGNCFEMKENRITFVLCTGIGVALYSICLI